MPYEVEMKFPVGNVQSLVAHLTKRGAVHVRTVEQTDAYFNHPSRDFAETDEAFRVRSVDGQHFVTYKGPLLDSETKTRHEIEVPVGTSERHGDEFQEILVHLGFREVRSVTKRRDYYTLDFENRPFEVCVDHVNGLGQFIELETIADEATLNAARESVQRLARHLGLEHPERRSYLQLLLEMDETEQTGGHGGHH